MKATRSEELLWKVTDEESASGETELGDELLRAYRSGALSPAEIERVETALCRSDRARARLAQIAGVGLSKPPERIRRRIFGEPVAPWYARGGSGLVWAAAAAILFAIVLVPFASRRFTGDRGAGPLPQGLAFDMRIEGLAAVRGDETRLPIALPSTPVRIVLEPKNEAVAGLSFGLYRREGDDLRRLDPGKEVFVEESRGSVTFTATADALVGSVPGDHELFAVVTSRATLPLHVPLDPKRPSDDVLRAATGGLAYRSVLTILDPDQQDSER